MKIAAPKEPFKKPFPKNAKTILKIVGVRSSNLHFKQAINPKGSDSPATQPSGSEGKTMETIFGTIPPKWTSGKDSKNLPKEPSKWTLVDRHGTKLRRKINRKNRRIRRDLRNPPVHRIPRFTASPGSPRL